jgi:hypothetical protein
VTVLFVYQGPQDPALEQRVCDAARDSFGVDTSRRGSHSGEDGMTTVTLDVGGDARPIVEWLRRQPAVIDAAQDSFGEHA